MTETPPREESPALPPASEIGARIAHGVLASPSLLIVAGLVCRAASKLDGAVLADLISRHGPAVIGMPFAAAIATGLVSGVRAIDGKLRISLLGLEIEGAGAALLGWIAAFSAIILAIRALW
jgi:hypothetical protein